MRGGKTVKAILKYPGAKNRIADWICEYIPKHDVYVEPYFGSGAIFFSKQPARIETINDMDGNVVNYFKVIRERPEELVQALRMTPYERDEYNNSFNINKTDNEIERARKFAVRCWQGFGCSNLYKNGFRSSQQSVSPYTTKEWRGLPERLIQASERLKNAQIENLPALELIKRYDTADVFMYIDPPYLHGTRKNNLYKYEMSDVDHEALLKEINKHKGKFLISGYENDMYNEYLAGWKKASKTTQAEAGLKRTETLWMNYDIGQLEIRID